MAAIVFFLLSSCVMGLLVAVPSAIERKKRDAEQRCWKNYRLNEGDPPLIIDASAECGSGPGTNYYNNASWTFWVNFPAPKYVNVQYDTNVQTGRYCAHDWISLSPENAPYLCGRQRGQLSFYMTSGYFYAMFHTDDSVTASGFTLNITVSSSPEYSTDTDGLPTFMEGEPHLSDIGATTATPSYWSPDFYTTDSYNDHYYTSDGYPYTSDGYPVYSDGYPYTSDSYLYTSGSSSTPCYRDLAIHSPGHNGLFIDGSAECGEPGQDYPDNADWTFGIDILTMDEYLNIEYDVNIEDCHQCSCDRLIFGYDTAATVQEIPVCGSQSGNFTVRIYNRMNYKLKFVSDGSVRRSGFRVNLSTDTVPYYSETDLPHYNRAPSGSSNDYDSSTTYRPYDSYTTYRPYNSYTTYRPYDSYTTYRPYDSYTTHRPHDSYTTYRPYNYYTTNRYDSQTYRPYDYYTTNYYATRYPNYGGESTDQVRESSEVRTAARLASLRTELRELTDAVREVVLTFDDFEAAYNNDNSPQYAEQPLSPEYMYKK